MSLLHFDCFSGMSGDMTLGALIDAGVDFALWKKEIGKLRLAGVKIRSSRVVRNGIAAVKIDVVTERQQQERNLTEITKIIRAAGYPKFIETTSITIFQRLAEAEARVHRTVRSKIHFHEVGALDAIVDIVGSVIGFSMFGVTEWTSSAINVGSGTVTATHGRLPVPAPATLELLKGFPIYANDIARELTTPTGAAILSTLVSQTTGMPAMEVRSVGYGAGRQNFDQQANVLRISVGQKSRFSARSRDTVVLFETNIDDMNPEWFDHVNELLLKAGALDVFLTPIIMKRSRPGVMLSVLAPSSLEELISRLLFTETTTIGIRVSRQERHKLKRTTRVVQTKWGKVRVKVAREGKKIYNEKPEYEDCVRIARRRGVPLKVVYRDALQSIQSRTE